MARKIKVSAGIINVRLHPHSRGTYLEWIEYIFRNKIITKMHGDRYGLISMIDKTGADLDIVRGTITTFVEIDYKGEWFSLDELKPATEEQISEINIPENLYPNSHAFYFHFNIRTHRFYFQEYSKGRTLTPRSALRLLQGLSANRNVLEKFKEAQLSIVQDQAGLEKIFQLKRIKVLTINIAKPNPDILDEDFEGKIEEHLAEAHSKQISITYQAEANGSVTPTRSVRRMAEAALDNGNVEATGRDEAGAVSLKTDDFPKVLHDKYDPDETNEQQAFLRLVRQEN